MEELAAAAAALSVEEKESAAAAAAAAATEAEQAEQQQQQHEYDEEEEDEDDEPECPICLGDLPSAGAEGGVLLTCSHAFYDGCLERWKASAWRRACPTPVPCVAGPPSWQRARVNGGGGRERGRGVDKCSSTSWQQGSRIVSSQQGQGEGCVLKKITEYAEQTRPWAQQHEGSKGIEEAAAASISFARGATGGRGAGRPECLIVHSDAHRTRLYSNAILRI